MRFFSAVVFSVLVAGCASKVLKYDKTDELGKNKEFESAVNIVMPAEPVPAIEGAAPTKVTTTTTLPAVNKKKAAKTPPQPKLIPEKKKKSLKHEPDIEPSEGFEGRRPIKDPFRVGEKVVHDVSYLGMTAGQLSFEVRPFATVNARKAYNLWTVLKTTSFFSSIYSVDDYATTLLDFEELIPSVYTLSVRESGQLREARAIFDFQNMKAKFWEKRVTKKDGEEEKKQEWEMLPYSQNVYSIAFYLRTFLWRVGDEHKFRVAHDNQNMVFRAKALREEELDTDAGKFKTIVIKAEMEIGGIFQQTGENYLWLTQDDRKFIVRIESKIKIGSLVSEVVQFNPGQ